MRAGLAGPPAWVAAGAPRAWLAAAAAASLPWGPEVPSARRSHLPRPWLLWTTRSSEELLVGQSGIPRDHPGRMAHESGHPAGTGPGPRFAGLAAPVAQPLSSSPVPAALARGFPGRDPEPRAPLKPAGKEPGVRGPGSRECARGARMHPGTARGKRGAARGIRPVRTEPPAGPNPLPTRAGAQGLQKRPRSLLFRRPGCGWGLRPERAPGSGRWARWGPCPACSKCGQWAEAPPGRGDGCSRAGRGEGDLWGQGAALSIWAGEVRGNQYFR